MTSNLKHIALQQTNTPPFDQASQEKIFVHITSAPRTFFQAAGIIRDGIAAW
jgi:hypothetical protein